MKEHRSGSKLQVEVFVDGMMPEGADAVDPSTWEHWLKCWLEALKPTASPINAYELSLRLTHDQEIQQLNATYRQQDKPTDVLAFAALEDTSPIDVELRQQIPTNLGDIVISVETAQRQAAKYGHSLKRELIWLSAHGLLHLLGWDHPDELSLQRMLSKQSDLLSLVGNPG